VKSFRCLILLIVAVAASGCAPGNAALVDACLSGNLAEVQLLLKKGVDIEGTAFDGLTPLDAAAQQGHLEVIKYLLSQGAAVNGTDRSPRNALALAAVYGHTDCVKYLISRGGEIRGTDQWNQGLLDTLKKDNQTELYEAVKQQIKSQANAHHP
jgi:uncharacterized protein